MLLETVTDLSNSTEQKSWLVARSNHSEYLDHHVVSLEIQLLHKNHTGPKRRLGAPLIRGRGFCPLYGTQLSQKLLFLSRPAKQQMQKRRKLT